MAQDVDGIIRQSEALERAQRYIDALNFVTEARRKTPGDRRLAIRQGQLLELTKQFTQALGLYRNLVEAQPKSQEADLVIGLARCMLKLGDHEQANRLFTEVQTKLPKHPDVLTGLAGYRRVKGQLDEAEALAREALESTPDFKRAAYVLAEVLIDKKDDEAALHVLERNVCREDLHGDSLDLWLATLKRLGRDRYTQDKLEELVAKYPNKPEFIFGLGVVSHRAGEISIARPALQQADRMLPNNARILHEWGVLERTAGNIELSQELLGRSLALQPEQPAALRTYGSEHKYRYGDAEFTRLNYAAARISDLEAVEQVHLHYALGKAFEDVEELDTAFRHYEIAGAKKRRMERYDERNAAQMFKVMPQLVNVKTLAQEPQPGCTSDVPVFILGMPRSGTSLLEQILSSHPDVFGAGELKFLPGVLDNISVGGRRINLNDTEPVFPYDENASWEVRGRRYVEKLEKLAGKPYKRIVDKMPGNFSLLGLIPAILPNAHIIHSRRHPVETCLSNYRIHFAEGQFWSYNLRELGRYYKRYWHLMKHWREQFPQSMLEVRYEDNVADVEGQARRIIEYLGLEWDPNCLNFYNTDRPVKTASASQVRKPIYTTSTNRWRKFEKYLGPLLEELGDIVGEYEAEIADLRSAA